ncbi:hypothetical protein ALC60_09177 [Trachymyrmex zeteki]|nr:hypothetical protein ALC60_09177 [Trachymyrmex zeteki]
MSPTNLKRHLKRVHKEAADNLIPIPRWIRGHYSKLTRNNEATCNHCNKKINVSITHLIFLHTHLVISHPDKLTGEEKKEVKFHWTWDYFTLKDDTEATCVICKATINCMSPTNLKRHLQRVHKNYFFREAADNLIPIRRWIRGHYSKLTRNNEATCNHCNKKINVYITHLFFLHTHLVISHPDKLTEEEKKEVKFHWTWDYFTLKDDTEATCVICKATINCTSPTNLKRHLKRVHK